NFTMFKQVFYYNNASKISVFQNYQNLKNYWVFNTLFAEFTFPKINLNAEVQALFSDYKFDQNLPNSLFEEK
ncbi:MAG: hypothetical protein HYU63_07280, partial [Armatimonadetes bacterium]|nr:hypothetical protein [Armatimonadota bacterium]